MEKNEASKAGGFPANSLFLPLIAVIAILHIVIVSLVFEANRSNSVLSEMMQNCSDDQQYATNLQAGSSTLSETASAFAQMPVGKDGAFNVGPLLRYAQELGRDRRGPEVAAWFRNRDVSAEAQAHIDAAAADSEQLMEIQLHAIALLRSVYPQPPLSELAVIPDYPLTEEELNMPGEERVEYARRLILDKDYSMLKASMADHVENCHRIIQQEYSIASSACERHIRTLRVWLWTVIFAIIFIMACTFVLIFRWLVLPLRSYARQITSDQSMDQISMIGEMRTVVTAYNALLRRHNKLESILRSAAERDSLTDLPNRYSLEQHILESSEDRGPMAVLLFDVNYLKRTNDVYGHMAGDKLICTAGACIRECFEEEGVGKCYRIGGDEFAAVLRNCGENDVKDRIDRFALVLEREHISISVGYAFSGKTDENSFEKLMKRADKRMYAQKKKIHEQYAGNQ